MDIRNWPLDRIMQLPDHCFGRRWPVIFTKQAAIQATSYFISELALPDTAVLWEIHSTIIIGGEATTSTYLPHNLKLGDQLPTADAQVAALDDLLPGLDERDAVGGILRDDIHLTRLRLPIAAQGRRVVLRLVNTEEVAIVFQLGLIFSSIPAEVPDWLLSR